jgi:putative UDP-N-acetylglucosamine diphosphorylase
MKASDLFDLPTSLERFSDFFTPEMAPWEWVKNIKSALESVDFSKLESKKDIPAGVAIEGDVYIHPTVSLPPYAHIKGPAWIGAHTEIRIGCFVRGNVIVGEGCVMGNSCEYKNSMLMDKVETPHYNYVGDSVLGTKSHLGAGVICANLRLDRNNVILTLPEGRIDSNMRKLGAMVAEYAEAGCNSVLQPGSILMKRSIVLSCVAFKGYIEENTMTGPKVQMRNLPRFGF